MQLVQCPTDPLLSCVLATAQLLPNGQKVQPLVKAEQDRFSVLLPQLVDCLVQNGSNLGEIRVLIRVHIEFSSLSLPELAAAFTPEHRGRDETRVLVQPSPKHDIPRKPVRFLGQVQENGLSHIFGEMGVAPDQAHRRRVDQIDIAFHELPKRLLRPALDVLCQQTLGFCHRFTVKGRRWEKSATKSH
jgi:hypothetical protein